MKLIQGGLVKTITNGDIPNGQILIDGGKIVAVGQNLDVPAGTEIIDAAGCVVTPGFIDAHCHIGIHEEATRWEGNDTNEYSSPVTPEIRAIDGINPMDEAFGNALGGGVTTAVTGPGSANVLGGSFVAMNNRVSQSVPHLHAHVVPRTKGDGLRGFFWPRTKYASDAEAQEYADRIAAAL